MTDLTLEQRIARLERATEYAPYQGRIRAAREIRDELEREQTYGPSVVESAGSPPSPRAVAGATSTAGDMPEWTCTRNGCRQINRSVSRRCKRCGETDFDSEPVESHACNSEPEPCSCEEALELRERIERAIKLISTSAGIGGPLSREVCQMLRGEA